jgi:hypothetical protein
MNQLELKLTIVPTIDQGRLSASADVVNQTLSKAVSVPAFDAESFASGLERAAASGAAAFQPVRDQITEIDAALSAPPSFEISTGDSLARISQLHDEVLTTVDQILSQPLVIPPLDIPPIELPPITVPPIEIPPVDTATLANSFNGLQSALHQQIAEQQSALSQLALDGQAGSAAFDQIAESIRNDKLELERMAEAAKVATAASSIEIPAPKTDQLAGSFNAVRSELQQSIASQKAAMAQLIVDGQGGSEAFQHLASSVHVGQEELKRLESASKQVENSIKSQEPVLERLKESFSEVGKVAAGFAVGSLATQGIGGLEHGVEALFEAGEKTLAINEQVELGFRQAGVSEEKVGDEMQRTVGFANELGLKLAVPASRIKEISGEAAFLGGVAGEQNQKVTELAVGIEKASHGLLGAEQTVRLFTKGATDPEAEASLTRLALKFPALATAVKEAATPAEAVDKAFAALGPTFSTLEEQAQGPLGTMENFQNTLTESKNSIGVLIIEGLQPLISGLGVVAHFVTDDVLPAFQNMGTGGKVLLGVLIGIPVLVVAGSVALGLLGQATSFVSSGFAKLGLTAGEAAVGEQAVAAAALETAAAQEAAGIAAEGAAALETSAGEEAAAAWLVGLGPIGLIIAAVGVLGGVITYLVTKTEAGKEAFDTVWSGIKALVSNAVPLLKAFADVAVAYLNPKNWFSGDGIEQAKKGLTDALLNAANDASANLKEAHLDRALESALELKEPLDKNNKLGELIEQYKHTTNEVEKRNIGKLIAEQVPEAVTEFDDLGNAVGINVDKAQQFHDVQQQTYGGELESKRKAYGAGLQQQARDLVGLKDKQAELTQQIIEGNKKGADTSAYREELKKLQVEIEESKKKLGETVSKGKEFGLIKGDVANVGQEFHLAGKEAAAVASSTHEIGEEAKQTESSLASMAAEFDKIKKSADDAVKNSLGALNDIKEKIRTELAKGSGADPKVLEDLRQQEREIIASGRRQQTEAERIRKENEQSEIELGIKRKERVKVQEEDLGKTLQKIDAETAKLRNEILAKGLDDQHASEKLALEQQREERIRQAEQSAREEIKKINQIAAESGDQKKTITINGQQIDPKAAIAKIKEAVQKEVSAIEDHFDEIDLPELLRKQFAEDNKILQDGLKAGADIMRINADVMLAFAREQAEHTGEAVLPALQKAAQLQRTALETENQLALSSAIRNSKIFQDETRDLFRQLADGTLTQADLETKLLAKEQELLTRAQQKPDDAVFAPILAAYLAANQKLGQFDRESKKQQRDQALQDELTDAVRNAHTLGEVERAQKVNEARKTFEAAIQAAQGNDVLEREAFLKFMHDREEIEKDFQRRSNVLVAVSLATEENLYKGFFSHTDQARIDSLKREEQDLERQSDAEIKALQSGSEAADAYFDHRRALAQKTHDVEIQLEREKFDIVAGLYRGLSTSFDQTAKQMTTQADTALARYKDLSTQTTAFFLEQGDTTFDAMVKSSKAADESAKVYKEAIVDTAVAFGSVVGKAAADGQNIVQSAGVSFIEMSVKLLQAKVVEWVLGIFGSSVEQLGPIAGPLAAAGITATLYALAGLAENALRGATPRASGGPIEGADVYLVNDDPWKRREFLMSGGPTALYEREFERINLGEDPHLVFGTIGYDEPPGVREALAIVALDHQRLRSEISDLRGIMQHGRDFSLVHQTEEWMREQRATTTAIQDLRRELRDSLTELTEEVKELRMERRGDAALELAEQVRTNERLGHPRGIVDNKRDLIGILIDLVDHLKKES